MEKGENVITRSFTLSVPDPDVDLTVNGRVLLPHIDVSGVSGLAVIIPGFLGYMDWGFYPVLADLLLDKHLAVILFNHSTGGNGTGGRPYSAIEGLRHMTIERDLADVREIFNAISSGGIDGFQGLKAKPVFLVGHSKGGAVAILSAAGQPSVVGIVSINGASDLLRIPKEKAQEIIERGYQEKLLPGTKITVRVEKDYWEQLLVNPDRYDVFKALDTLSKKILIVQGALDDKVSVAEAQKMHKSAPPDSKLIIREGIDHNLGYNGLLAGLPGENALQLMNDIAGWIRDAL